jgi:hypothetical protein
MRAAGVTSSRRSARVLTSAAAIACVSGLGIVGAGPGVVVGGGALPVAGGAGGIGRGA